MRQLGPFDLFVQTETDSFDSCLWRRFLKGSMSLCRLTVPVVVKSQETISIIEQKSRNAERVFPKLS